jgi:hypothetical protein
LLASQKGPDGVVRHFSRSAFLRELNERPQAAASNSTDEK